MSRRTIIATTLGITSLALAGLLTLMPTRDARGGAPFIVNTTDEDSDGACEGAPEDCTIREAILAANATTMAEVHFDIPGCPPSCTISLQSVLPTITGTGTEIDATTQSGAGDQPVVVLDGSALSPPTAAPGLLLQANDVLVKGLILQNFPGAGVNSNLDPYSGRRVEGNLIRDNGGDGVSMSGTGGIIKDNVIERNGGDTWDGITAFFGDVNDLLVTGNTIRNNGGLGVAIAGNDSVITENVVEGNGRDGIVSQSASGATTISDNTVSGNGERGITVSGPQSVTVTGNTVQNNGWEGIISFSAGGGVISGNLVDANGSAGSLFRAGPSSAGPTGDEEASDGMSLGGEAYAVTDNVITNNFGNGLSLNAPGSMIGGDAASEGNTIVANAGAGILIAEFVPAPPPRLAHPTGLEDTSDVSILGNSISSNGGLGIDLGNPGVTENDAGDGDSGANRRQNWPVLASAVSGSLAIAGTLNSGQNTAYRIEFFTSDECDPSGNGEGAQFVGFFQGATGAFNDLHFSADLGADVPAGKYVTATATNLVTHDTSEFSNCVHVTGFATPTPSATPASTPTPTPTPTSATPTPTPTPTGGAARTQGDNQCDEDVDAADALTSLQANAALPYQQEDNCQPIGSEVAGVAAPAGDLALFGDVDCDGDVDAVDALKILQYLAALPFTQDEPCTDIGDELS